MHADPDTDQAPAPFDGNLLAGPLAEVFTAEMTTAVGHCRGCGLASAVATLRVYAPETGLVGRCPGCGDVSVRMVRTDDALWLDLSGLSAVRIPLPESPDPDARIDLDDRSG